MRPIERILCPVDFSDCSRAALSSAIDLSERLSAKLQVLHAYHVAHTVQPTLLVWMNTGPRPLSEIAAEQAETETRSFIESFPGHSRELDAVVIHDEPASAIVRYATEHDYDLIVMGTHGRSAVSHMLNGSVAETVVRRAPCPVLVVHKNEALKRPADAISIATPGDSAPSNDKARSASHA